jgi:hypothetical protein
VSWSTTLSMGTSFGSDLRANVRPLAQNHCIRQ